MKSHDPILARLIAGWQFGVFVLSLLASSTAALAAVLFIDAPDTALGQFAREFRIWCFGYNPESDQTQWVYPITMILQPLLLGWMVWGLWGSTIRRGARPWLRAIPAAALGFGVVATASGLLVTQRGAMPDGPPVFPAEALRTSHTPAPFSLIDHEGNSVELSQLSNRVVVVTGVYASCGFTCPMIMAQAKRVLNQLTQEERAEVTVIAITLDPTRDTRERLAAMAAAQGVSAPTFRLVNGPDPALVEAVLDRYAFARRRNPETGVIDHTNLFVVIDRQGRIAYRFSLGEHQEAWLVSALRLLLREGQLALNVEG